jgi:hypothetical protein
LESFTSPIFMKMPQPLIVFFIQSLTKYLIKVM